jgi:hypothetical protein
MPAASPLAVAIAVLQAYVDKDRNAIEALIADDYRFTSPLDNGLDRRAYFEICWPNNRIFTRIDFLERAESGERAFVVYEGHATSTAGHISRIFRNCEVHTVRDGKLVATEVYFGWNVPHPVPPGRHKSPA